MKDSELVRINKYLSESGYCSRRTADSYVNDGRVTVNDEVCGIGAKISIKDDVIRVDGELISAKKKKKPLYLAFNKPVGIVCTTDSKVEKDNIIDYINYPRRIFPIGRLDKLSEGLIFLTNDGDIVNKILRARNNHEKEYLVNVNKPVTKEFIQKMGNGVRILDTVSRKCHVEQVSKYEFKIILTQGLNRQIRRMCETLDFKVKKLRRTRIMNVSLDIPVGKWRYITEAELEEINRLVSDSDSDKSISKPISKSKPRKAFKSKPESKSKSKPESKLKSTLSLSLNPKSSANSKSSFNSKSSSKSNSKSSFKSNSKFKTSSKTNPKFKSSGKSNSKFKSKSR